MGTGRLVSATYVAHEVSEQLIRIEAVWLVRSMGVAHAGIVAWGWGEHHHHGSQLDERHERLEEAATAPRWGNLHIST